MPAAQRLVISVEIQCCKESYKMFQLTSLSKIGK